MYIKVVLFACWNWANKFFKISLSLYYQTIKKIQQYRQKRRCDTTFDRLDFKLNSWSQGAGFFSIETPTWHCIDRRGRLMCNTNNTYRLFALKNAFMAKTDIVTKYQKMEKKTIHWYIWLIVCSDVFKRIITW